MIANPPFHQGRAAEPDLGAAFIAAAARILEPSGGSSWWPTASSPTRRCLPAPSGAGEARARTGGYKVLEAEAPRAAAIAAAGAGGYGGGGGPPMTDPVALTAELIRCPSVTPEEGGAITLLEARLAAAGFRTVAGRPRGIANLFARWGTAGPVLGFNGHTDVVPPGDRGRWRHDPFAAVVEDGRLYGRGAADMKSGVAAFVAAAIDFVAATPPAGSVVVTVTGDEEGDGVDGTARDPRLDGRDTASGSTIASSASRPARAGWAR